MSFECPECKTNSLGITSVLELPPDGWSDEVTLQIVTCGACAFRGVAVYEESRRGGSESWHHVGYQLNDDDWQSLAQALARCPAPRDSRCRCATHVLLDKQNENSTWDGLGQNGITILRQFPMRYVAT